MIIVPIVARSFSSYDVSFDMDFGSAQIRRDGPRVTLFLDDVGPPAIDILDPAYLEFEYVQHMGAVVSSLQGPQGRLRVPHVGSAARALACIWPSSRPNSYHVAVEIDRLSAEQMCEHFPTPEAPQVRIRVGDGCAVLDGA